MNEEYTRFKLPTNIVPFNAMLTDIGFPKTYGEYDDYLMPLSDAKKYEIIGQLYCVLDKTQQLIITSYFREAFKILKQMNK